MCRESTPDLCAALWDISRIQTKWSPPPLGSRPVVSLAPMIKRLASQRSGPAGILVAVKVSLVTVEGQFVAVGLDRRYSIALAPAGSNPGPAGFVRHQSLAEAIALPSRSVSISPVFGWPCRTAKAPAGRGPRPGRSPRHQRNRVLDHISAPFAPRPRDGRQPLPPRSSEGSSSAASLR